MEEQEKDQKHPTAEIETPEESQPEEEHDRFKETTEKIWGSTRQVWSNATFKANQYKKLVQKKIDISALHKKIGAAHSELGKMIDDLREEGKKNLMNLAEVKEILTRLDELKSEAAALEEEVEQLKTEEPPQEAEQDEENPG
jgi:hypothetical protein